MNKVDMEFIAECANMLRDKAEKDNRGTISPEILQQIMTYYIAKYYSNMPSKQSVDNIIELCHNTSFVGTMQKNKEKEERLRKARIENNKKVLRAYRIKPS